MCCQPQYFYRPIGSCWVCGQYHTDPLYFQIFFPVTLWANYNLRFWTFVHLDLPFLSWVLPLHEVSPLNTSPRMSPLLNHYIILSIGFAKWLIHGLQEHNNPTAKASIILTNIISLFHAFCWCAPIHFICSFLVVLVSHPVMPVAANSSTLISSQCAIL